MNKIFNEDILLGVDKIEDNSIDLKLTYQWIDAVLPKLKKTGSFYIFLSWQYSPEIFVYLKKRLRMINEIIWDRRVPSMGGSTRKFSSVHDNIGFFVKDSDYYFDLDSIRIPYDEETKKARTRSIFIGKKWLEIGYNPKDLWSASRIHAQAPERENHPTQKPLEIIERIIKASCPVNGIVLDPFMGTGTTAIAAINTKRNYIGFEINKNYCKIIGERISSSEGRTGLFKDIIKHKNLTLEWQP